VPYNINVLPKITSSDPLYIRHVYYPHRSDIQQLAAHFSTPLTPFQQANQDEGYPSFPVACLHGAAIKYISAYIYIYCSYILIICYMH